MLIKKVVIASIFFVLLVTLSLVFRPTPRASIEKTSRTFGTIEAVFELGDSGLVLKSKDDSRLYYITQGPQGSLNPGALNVELTGKPVEIHYVKYWTPIDPLIRRKLITKVDVNRTTIYPVLK